MNHVGPLADRLFDPDTARLLQYLVWSALAVPFAVAVIWLRLRVRIERLNVTRIRSRTAWARIELSDEQIGQIASGLFVLQVVPRS